MSVLDIFAFLDDYPVIPVIFFTAIPLTALLLRFIHGKNGGTVSPFTYIYSVLIYLSCIPGIFILFIIFYLAVFQHENIFTLSVFSFFLPPLSMLFTLIIIRKTIPFDDIPGFDKIAGLIGYIVCTFVILLIMDRLRIFLFFRASFMMFVLIWIILFVFLRISTRKIFGYFKKK